MNRLILVANGQPLDLDLLRPRLRADDVFLAADGGARHCRALGVRPHIVIGDLDSLTPDEQAQLEAEGISMERHPAHKDETDLELALLYAVKNFTAPIVILAALGGRMDMALANILLLTHPALAGRRVEVWNGAQTAWLIRPPGDEVRGDLGDTVSLIPLDGAAQGVTTRGLEYALRDEPLAFGPARGVSNVLTETVAHIALRAGSVLVVHTPGRA